MCYLKSMGKLLTHQLTTWANTIVQLHLLDKELPCVAIAAYFQLSKSVYVTSCQSYTALYDRNLRL